MRENTIDRNLSHADKSRVRVVRIKIFARSNFKNDLCTDPSTGPSTIRMYDTRVSWYIGRSIARSSRG